MYYYYSYVYLAIFVCIIYEHVVYDSMYMLLIALTGPHWLVHLCIVMYDCEIPDFPCCTHFVADCSVTTVVYCIQLCVIGKSHFIVLYSMTVLHNISLFASELCGLLIHQWI